MNTALSTLELENPFPGLRPFQQGQEHLFFGREKQTDKLVDRLKQTHFLAVIGSSGSGKSSLVNCGLLNALHMGLMSESGTTWRIAHLRPAGQPMNSLATALAEPSVLFEHFDNKAIELIDIVDSTLHMSTRGISDVFDLSKQKPNANLLVVVDQFEELFRYSTVDDLDAALVNKRKSEASQFVKLLLDASSQPHSRIYIVITMRSDFLGDCTSFDGLAEAINQGQYLVPRMTRSERRSAIVGPVRVSGASMDSILLTRLINDLGNELDQLPIMQHALHRIWDRWNEIGQKQEPLSLVHYSAIGSMKLALDTHAEEAFAELDPIRQQVLCEKIFKALTNKATDNRGVRRPASVESLLALTGSSIHELTQVIDTFRSPSRAFLTPPITQALKLETIVDISHESLMRMWKRLVSWANEEAESTRIYQRLASTAELNSNHQAGLWRDPDLQLALEWRLHNTPNASWAARIQPGFEKAMAFLDDSRAANDLETAENRRREEQEHELERTQAIASEQKIRIAAQERAARKQRQVKTLVIGGLIVTSVMLSLLAVKSGQLQEKTDKLEVQAIALEKENAVVVKTREEKQQILTTAIELLNQQKIINYDKTMPLEFVNKTDAKVLIFLLNESGYESYSTFIETGSSSEIVGFENQIWVARSGLDAQLVTTGFFDVNANAFDVIDEGEAY